MKRQGRYPAEVREWAVRLVLESQEAQGSRWAAITSVAAKLGWVWLLPVLTVAERAAA
jgi:transposase-like protein